MFNLNFDEGRPIAFINGGEYDKEILYLNSNKEHKNKKKVNIDDIAILIENLYRTMNGKISFKTLEQLRDAIMERRRPVNRELARHYDHALKILDKNKNKEIVLQEGELTTMFDTTLERQVFMVAGMSGSGKSTYTAGLCRTYKRQYPENKIILFSNKPSAHQANNYAQTRTILNECMSITIFPAMTTRYSLNYLLSKYFGFDKNQINKICKLPSRWVTIFKSPPLILYSSGAYLVNDI
jgi:signal recognition particle GTPase